MIATLAVVLLAPLATDLPGAKLDQIVFATDRPESRLHRVLAACPSVDRLSETAGREDLIVHFEDGVAYAFPSNVRRAQDAEDRRLLMAHAATASQLAFQQFDLNKLEPLLQRSARRIVASNPNAGVFLQAKPAYFTIQPFVRITLADGDRSLVAEVLPERQEEVDKETDYMVQRRQALPPFPMDIAPSPDQQRFKDLSISFPKSGGDAKERSLHEARIQEIVNELLTKRCEEYDVVSEKLKSTLLRLHPDIVVPADAQRYFSLDAIWRKRIERHLSVGYSRGFSTLKEATDFLLTDPPITSFEYGSALVFRILEFEQTGRYGTKEVLVTVPVLNLENPIGR